MTSNRTTKQIGSRGERLAARYLRRHGFRIVARNRHCGHNELDLIAKNKEFILFVEVKTRSFESESDVQARPPFLAVDAQKRRRTLDAAHAYLREHPTSRCPRMDVIEVCLDRTTLKPFRIHHIAGAFDARGRIH